MAKIVGKMMLEGMRLSPILTTSEQCNEWNKLLGKISQLQIKNKLLKKEKADLRAELCEWQCGIMTLEEYEATIRPT